MESPEAREKYIEKFAKQLVPSQQEYEEMMFRFAAFGVCSIEVTLDAEGNINRKFVTTEAVEGK